MGLNQLVCMSKLDINQFWLAAAMDRSPISKLRSEVWLARYRTTFWIWARGCTMPGRSGVQAIFLKNGWTNSLGERHCPIPWHSTCSLIMKIQLGDKSKFCCKSYAPMDIVGAFCNNDQAHRTRGSQHGVVPAHSNGKGAPWSTARSWCIGQPTII